MTELGEPISAPEFVSDELHSEKTCPWHEEKKPGEAKAMKEQHEDDDNLGVAPMDKNCGGDLGGNMGAKSNETLDIGYDDSGSLWYVARGGKKKETAVYVRIKDSKPFPLQFAAHHLVPGNASLKGSAIVKYLGDDTVITNYKGKGVTSEIKKGQTAGYDVNCLQNGEWLPSPYALSMGGKDWPASEAIKAIVKKHGIEAGETAEEFKKAYAYAAMTNTGKQFHLSHTIYSNEVRTTLGMIAAKIKEIVKPRKEVICPYAQKKKDDDKLDAPGGLPGRLNALSSNLRRLVTGDVWRPPLYTDAVVATYFSDHLKKKAQALKGQIEKVM